MTQKIIYTWKLSTMYRLQKIVLLELLGMHICFFVFFKLMKKKQQCCLNYWECTFFFFLTKEKKSWVMLPSFPWTLINNLFWESFDTIFMKNEKSCQNINYFFFFFHKNFFKWIINQCPNYPFQECTFFFLTKEKKSWVMLPSFPRALVNNSFYESFDITFMRNEKNC